MGKSGVKKCGSGEGELQTFAGRGVGSITKWGRGLTRKGWRKNGRRGKGGFVTLKETMGIIKNFTGSSLSKLYIFSDWPTKRQTDAHANSYTNQIRSQKSWILENPAKFVKTILIQIKLAPEFIVHMFHSRSYLKCRLNTMIPLFLPIISLLELLLVNKLRCGETVVRKNSSFITVTFFFIYPTEQSVIVSTRQKVINKTLCRVQLTSGWKTHFYKNWRMWLQQKSKKSLQKFCILQSYCISLQCY